MHVKKAILSVLLMSILSIIIRMWRYVPHKVTVKQHGQSSRETRQVALLATSPKPIVVVAAGIPRTGSTWIFNILRILMRIRDPNSIAGWFEDLEGIWKSQNRHNYDDIGISWLEAYKSFGTSLLIKVHDPRSFEKFSKGYSLSDRANLTVLTYRDLRAEVKSWMYQRYNGSIHSGDIENTPFADPAEWVKVSRRVLLKRNLTLASVGTGSQLLDIKYEDWSKKSDEIQMNTVRKMANALQWDFTEEEMKDALMEEKRIISPSDSSYLSYNPVTGLHPSHGTVNSEEPAILKALEIGYEAIENDSISGEFLQQNGYM